jgi:XPA protein C-terminus
MELTAEQRDRMQRNRERALEIQKKRREAADAARSLVVVSPEEGEEEIKAKRRRKLDAIKDEEPLEQFEEGASEYVNKTEAIKMYCLPEGTLAVCEYVEKQNPRHKSWVPMKLYHRSEIRKRARERWGGMEGLIAERRRREEKKFMNDLEKTKDIFK